MARTLRRIQVRGRECVVLLDFGSGAAAPRLYLSPWAARALQDVRTSVLDAMARELAARKGSTDHALAALTGFLAAAELQRSPGEVLGCSVTLQELASVGWERVRDVSVDGLRVRVAVGTDAECLFVRSPSRWTADVCVWPQSLACVDDRNTTVRAPLFPLRCGPSFAEALSDAQAQLARLHAAVAEVARVLDSRCASLVAGGVPSVRLWLCGDETRDVPIPTASGFATLADIDAQYPRPASVPECAICAETWHMQCPPSLACAGCATTMHAACWLRFAEGHPSVRRVFARVSGPCPACHSPISVDCDR